MNTTQVRKECSAQTGLLGKYVLRSCGKWEETYKTGRESMTPFLNNPNPAEFGCYCQLLLSWESARCSHENRKYISNNEHSQAPLHAAAQGAAHFSLILFSLDLTFHQEMAPLGWLMQFDAIYCISSGLPSISNKLRAWSIFIMLINLVKQCSNAVCWFFCAVRLTPAS